MARDSTSAYIFEYQPLPPYVHFTFWEGGWRGGRGEGRGGRKGGGEEGKGGGGGGWGGGGGKKLFPPKLKILTHTVHTGVRTVPGSASINSRFIPIGGHSYLASPKLIYIYINFP